MFTPPPTAGLTSQPRKGIGARVAGGFSRLGAALRSVVAGGPRRPPSGPDSRTAPDADRPPAARQARAPRPPGRARKGGLARLFGRRRPTAAVPEQSRELADFEFTGEAFPELSPEARAFFNTPLEECDPALLGIVLEALAELIAGAMTPQEGMRDARDVFLALSSRMAAVSGEAGDAPPAALPEAAAAPADSAATAAIDPQAAVARASPAQRCAGTQPRRASEGTDVAQGAAAAASAAPDQPATAPAGPQPSGAPVSGGTSTKNARAADRSRVPPRHARRRLFRDRPGFATRQPHIATQEHSIPQSICGSALPRPPRLLCYAACAGPPALLRRA